MTHTEIERVLIEVIYKIQELSGRETVHVDPQTRPVIDLPEFDSLNGVEVTVDLMDRLKVEFEFNNMLVEDGRALTISEAAGRLLQSMPRQ